MKKQSKLKNCLLILMIVMPGYGSTAAAAQPDFAIELPAGLGCDFDLLIEGWGGKRHVKEFTDESGNIVRLLDTGTGFALRFTNISTHRKFSTKSNGAVSHTRFNLDGSSTVTATGHNVLVLFPTDFPAGPSTTLFVGRLVYEVDSSEIFTVLETNGREIDICLNLS